MGRLVSEGENVIDVMLATDGRGMFMAHITIASLLASAKGDRPIRINLLVDGFTDEMKAVIRREVDKYPFAEIRFVEVAEVLQPHIETLRNGMKTCGVGSAVLMTWARCFCDVLLPDVTGKFVYMDTDTYVADDIALLADVDLEGHVFGAVPESSRNTKGSWLVRLQLDADFYFCAGVMVFDLDEYRRLGGSKRLMEVVEANKERIALADQDALNCFAEGNVKALHPRWNYNDGWIGKQFRFSLKGADWRGKSPKEILEAIISPGIIHYQNKNKPWRFNHRPEGRRYERLMRKMGYLKTRFLPGSNPAKELVRAFFDGYHFILIQIAKLRYKLCR
jgi:lipopolysaccharide biosynthesis glycosyltransferase